MNRRELVTWALVAPLARSAKLLPRRALQVRLFADLKHTGRLAGPVNTRAITDADFGIAVPLPTLAAEGDLLPAEDAEKTNLASRLGLLRIETSEPRTQLVVSVAGEGAAALRLYRKAAEGWRRVSTAPMSWTLTTDDRGRVDAGIGVVLPSPSEGAEQPTWPRAFSLEIAATGVEPQRIPFRVAPFIIPCALEKAEEVLIVSRASTADAVNDLKQWSASTKIPVYTLDAQRTRATSGCRTRWNPACSRFRPRVV